MRRYFACLLFYFLLHSAIAYASIFGTVQGVVHDPQHRPVSGATVNLRASHSNFTVTGQTNTQGAFSLPAIPLGDYTVTVSQTGFRPVAEMITLASNTSPVLHFELPVGDVKESVTVSGLSDVANVNSVTPTTLVSRQDIAFTPRCGPHQQYGHDYGLRAWRVYDSRYASYAWRSPDLLAHRWYSDSQYQHRQ